MSKVLSMEEWRKLLRPKKAPTDSPLLNRLIEGQEKFDYGETNAHMTHEMAVWYGMPKPPAPSISSFGGVLVNHETEDEVEFPPPAC